MKHPPQPALIVRRAARRADLAEVASLMRDYVAGIGVDLCFQDFEEEVASLPGGYAPPYGLLLLCRIDGRPAGCAAVRRVSDEDAEMKRVFVREAFRGRGAGERLARRAIGWAVETGYRRLLLDTLPSMVAAQRMYERLGFLDTEPYRHNPVAGARFLALNLEATATPRRGAAVPGAQLSSSGGDPPRR